MMVQSSKIQKCITASDEKDRISSLPDGILAHILSFIPTKDAVQTSLLSTRWKSLWTSVPNFDFSCYNREEGSSFMDFVDRVLLLRNLQSINRFGLQLCYLYCDPYQVSSWICTAIKCNVKELVLDFYTESFLELPPSLLTSVSLVTLKLSGDVSFQFPMVVFLPSLKVLHLPSMGFPDDESFKSLISGCPVLEELEIERSRRDKMNTLCICSSTLKKLSIRRASSIDINFPYGVVLKSPSLEIFELDDYVTEAFDVEELASVVKAKLYVSFHPWEYEDDHCNIVDGMLGKIPNVRHLKLSSATLKVLMQAPAYNVLLFQKLTHLHLYIDDIHWSFLPDLLQHMPNVKGLVLKKGRKWHSSFLGRALPEVVPKCLSLCLETLDYSGFEGCDEEMKLVRYLLENAVVLKKFTLTSWTRNKEIRTNILNFQKGSSTCQIDLRYRDRKGLYCNPVVEWL